MDKIMREHSIHQLTQAILRTDASGLPLEWINFQQAVKYYYLGVVLYECGSDLLTVHGGINAKTGIRSELQINSIIATHGGIYAKNKLHENYTPPLSNPALFQRDFNLCLYCGQKFQDSELSRDHVTPIVRGGKDEWNNCVTACKRCNQHKGSHRPEEAGMKLLAIPFTPNHAEFIFLQKKRILADQMVFLRAHFPRTSPLHERIDQNFIASSQ